MVRLEIKKNDAGQRVDKFITKAFPELPSSIMYKAIRQKDVKLNRKRCEISTRLCEGDVLEIYIKDELLGTKKENSLPDFMRSGSRLSIAYEDDHVLIADKPQGLIVHPDDEFQTDTLIARIQRYLYEDGQYDPTDEQSFAPALVNRIDRNTAGLVIAAKDAAALRILNEKMKAREIHKKYLCIVHGVVKKRSDTLTGWLEKNEAQNRVYVENSPTRSTKSISTRYRLLAVSGQLSLLEVELLTGRTHQIRAHLASIGHPLLGDGKYGTNQQNKRYGVNKQALYSYSLSFDFVTPAHELEYLKGEKITVPVRFAEEFLSQSGIRMVDESFTLPKPIK